MRAVSPAKVNNQKVEDTSCQPRGWRALLSHVKKTTLGCGTPSGRNNLWSYWKWSFIPVENQGSGRQWEILLLLPPCQTQQRIYQLFNSVSGLFLHLLPQAQITGLELINPITYLWVLLITLNDFVTHLDFSECSHNFGHKITKPLVLIQITDNLNKPTVTWEMKNSIAQLSSCICQIQSHRLSSNKCCPVLQVLIIKTPWKFLAQRKTSQYTHQDTTADSL